MASRAKKGVKRKGMLLRIAVVLFLCFVCYTIVKLQIGISQMRARLADIEKENAAIEMEIAEKEITLQEGATKENVERIARETLNYVYPDEIIYTDLP
ncbi:MAG: septum formation initiator family protein [Clostridia bacterium]|nr:septum formation initiator family protein [Clostridia bacterium]